MKLKYLLATSVVGLTAAAGAAPAYAQSTGSVDFDEENVLVVTGTRTTDVAGVEIPDSPKAKVQIGSELIQRQAPGQTINDTLNLVPGVSFQNDDPFGSLGGTFSIRGFSSDRISQTFDGVPLNDSGNYALYTNQMLDPEIIEYATVSLGSTDVDSPTAAAAGGTINIRSKTPDEEFGVMTSLTYGNIIARGNPGDRPMYRGFVKVETGNLTSGGLRAYVTASRTENDSVFSNYGGVDKQQYNAKIFQPLGDNGDFIAVAGHYNQNRNNFNGSPAFFGGAPGYSIQDPEDRFYELYDGTPCTVVIGTTGVQDGYNSCGQPFERRYNPSNTGNIRGTSRFTITDALTLTVDPSFQYVKANGGGTSIGFEGLSADGFTGGAYLTDPRNPQRATRPTQYYYFGGVDLNNDGDTLDYVTISSPSQTQTRRYGLITNLIYDISDTQRVRLAYTFDRARHRQTGTAGALLTNAEPVDVFAINNPLLDANGVAPQKRNRKSFATLHQVSAEYRGEFGDLVATLGLRAPFFSRDLDQYCVTTDGTGNVNCINGDAAIAAYVAANPGTVAPTSADYKYDKLLPNVGLTYNFTPAFSVFASYAMNLSVPGTDALYGSIFTGVAPIAETSDSFDAGLRFQSGTVQAQLSGWFNQYQNRLRESYDEVTQTSTYVNLGKVNKYGVDGSIAWQPIRALSIYAWGSYLVSDIKNDVIAGTSCDPDDVADGFCYDQGGFGYFTTAGMREAGAPEYTVGARAQGNLGPVEIGFQVKRTGERWLNDVNTVSLPAYTTADADVRVNLGYFDEDLDKAYFQVNVTNLFDELYVGGTRGYDIATTGDYVNIGPPRAITASLIWGF
ncbi:TonB-dependent receptor [Alteriqipengyuania sp.]|uniref:TonB-dependent receptor n=1 Tax=Alteriqipengyuania sp. TaxID=2800692 RepID=UPI003512169C